MFFFSLFLFCYENALVCSSKLSRNHTFHMLSSSTTSLTSHSPSELFLCLDFAALGRTQEPDRMNRSRAWSTVIKQVGLMHYHSDQMSQNFARHAFYWVCGLNRLQILTVPLQRSRIFFFIYIYFISVDSLDPVTLFPRATLESIIQFAWYSNVTVQLRNKLAQMHTSAVKIIIKNDYEPWQALKVWVASIKKAWPAIWQQCVQM